jgi:hypothetical protein
MRQRRKQARPQELLNAALELFVEKGYSATRSDEVASRAGVSKGTLYLYRLISGTLQRGIQRGEFRVVPVNEATHALIAPMLFQALHKHSVGACPVMGPDMSPSRQIDTQIDLMLHGLEQRAAPAPAQIARPRRVAA